MTLNQRKRKATGVLGSRNAKRSTSNGNSTNGVASANVGGSINKSQTVDVAIKMNGGAKEMTEMEAELAFQQQLLYNSVQFAHKPSISIHNKDDVDEQSYLNGCINESDRILRVFDEVKDEKNAALLPASFFIIYAFALYRHSLKLLIPSNLHDTSINDPAVLLPNLIDSISENYDDKSKTEDGLNALSITQEIARKAIDTNGKLLDEAELIINLAEILKITFSTIIGKPNDELPESILDKLISSLSHLPINYTTPLGTHKVTICYQVVSFLLSIPKLISVNDNLKFEFESKFDLNISNGDDEANNEIHNVECDDVFNICSKLLNQTDCLKKDINIYIDKDAIYNVSNNTNENNKDKNLDNLIKLSTIQIAMARAQGLFFLCDYILSYNNEESDEESLNSDDLEDKSDKNISDSTLSYLKDLYFTIVNDMSNKYVLSEEYLSSIQEAFGLNKFDDIITDTISAAVTNKSPGIERIIEAKTLLAECLIALGNISNDDDEEEKYYNQAVKILKFLEKVDIKLNSTTRKLLPSHFAEILEEWET